MSQISNCAVIEPPEQFTKRNLDLLRGLFNGESVNIEGTKYNLGDSITKDYGNVDSEFGRKMFDIIVDRGTGKPANDSFTGFTEADFRRTKNEILKEAKNLKNPKLSILERNLFVRRGVMNKYAITKYINREGIGGKKLSYEDRSTQMTDVNKIQYILEVDKKGKKRDIQVSRIAGKFVIQDPYNELNIKDISKEIKEIERIENEVDNNRTMGTLFDKYNELNKTSDSKYYLENLSLRMPNLGGDVAIQKVEGFYNREQGNVVGINVYDIAQTHQADFDVDMAFNYHLKSSKLSNSIWKDLGSSVDAYIFPTDLSSMDIFGFGKASDGQVVKAGLGTGYDDNLSNHMQLFQKSKKNFGVVKKLSTELSFFLRSPDLINLSGLEVTSISKSNKKQYRAFLQGYKNTLQSIIDAAKKPNWASKADQQQILDYILFGDKPPDYNLDNELSNYGQEGFNGFFKIKGEGPSREIKKDLIKEIIRVKSKSQRILTDVFDSSGRRAPEPNEIGMVRSELNSFYKNKLCT